MNSTSGNGARRSGIDAAIRARLRQATSGRVFSPEDFADLGARAAVDKVISRLAATTNPTHCTWLVRRTARTRSAQTLAAGGGEYRACPGRQRELAAAAIRRLRREFAGPQRAGADEAGVPRRWRVARGAGWQAGDPSQAHDPSQYDDGRAN